MKKIKIVIKAVESLLITGNTGDPNMVATCDYIKGTNILGLFAGKYLKDYPVDQKFYHLFLRGELIFCNANITANGKSAIATPLSIQYEKHNKERICDLINTDKNLGKSTPIGGYCIIDRTQPAAEFAKILVSVSLNFHHERKRETGITERGVIFNYQSLGKGQAFEGEIRGSEDDLNLVKGLFKKGETAYIGRSKSAQYGKVIIEIGDIEEISSKVDTPVEPHVMTMLSDTIIYNDMGFSTTDTHQLERLIGTTIKKSFIKSSFAEHFNNQWKAKKPSEIVFMAGSCFLLEKLPDNFTEFETSGLGERTHEGYGQVAFGIQKVGEYHGAKVTQVQHELEAEVPETARKIIHKVLQDSIEAEITLKAFESTERINGKKITNSLVNRLAGFAKHDPTKFHRMLEELRPTARKQLESAYVDDDTLFEYLKKTETLLSLTLETYLKKNKLNDIIQYDQKSDMSEWHRIYLQSFFNQLRRNSKKGK